MKYLISLCFILTGCVQQTTLVDTADLNTAPVSNKQPTAMQRDTTECPAQKNLHPIAKGILRARGEGASFDEALRVALANLSIQRQIVVTSRSESERVKKEHEATSYFRSSINTSSNMVFSDYKITCRGHHSAIVIYDNRPLTDRINSLISDGKPSSYYIAGENWLLQSPLFSGLPSSPVSDSRKISVSAYEESSQWFIKLNDELLKLREQEWRQLYRLPDSSKDKYRIDLVTEDGRKLSGRIRNQQEFRLKIHYANKHNSFLTLLYIDSSADVTPIRINKPLGNRYVIQIPEGDGIFSTQLNDAEIGLDDYIAIISDKPLTIPSEHGQFYEWLSIAGGHVVIAQRVLVK